MRGCATICDCEVTGLRVDQVEVGPLDGWL
ncbi:hypothetical protein M3J09_005211 [Ascochyta lentis]